MNFQQLRYVREAVRQGLNLTEAANALFTSQPGISKQIRELEQELGVEIFVRHAKESRGCWARVSGRPLRDAVGEVTGGVIVCRDITAIKEEEFFRAGQSAVLEMIAADAPLSDVLKSLVLLMEGQADGLRCSILLLARDGKHVRHGAAPHLPEAYVKAVDGAPVRVRHG